MLEFKGTIPSYCSGVLYRTGPGRREVETDNGKVASVSHWFDGLSQVHRFEILAPSHTPGSATVLYNSRFTVDSLIERIKETGNFDKFTFGQKRDPCESLFKKMSSIFKSSLESRELVAGNDPEADGRNVNVSLLLNMPGSPPGDKGMDRSVGINSLVTSTDANEHQTLDLRTLEPKEIFSQTTFLPSLSGPLTANHYQRDPVTGDIYNYNLDLGVRTIYRVFCISQSTGRSIILATITNAPPAYVHSLFLTPRHVILCVWGARLAMRGLKVLYTHNILDALADYDSSQPCRWYVVDRSSDQRGVMATFTTPSFFAFHTINAYEEPSLTMSGEVDIIADVVCYDNLSILKRFYYENLRSSSSEAFAWQANKTDADRPWFGRFRLPNVPRIAETHSREAVVEWRADKNQTVELPSVHPRWATRKHRYVYGVVDRGLSTLFDGISKFDVETHTSVVWSQQGHTPGEPIFVADPDSDEEDGGVLLSVVLDGYKGDSYLLILDARTMKETGRADVGHGVPHGFHGVHVPSMF